MAKFRFQKKTVSVIQMLLKLLKVKVLQMKSHKPDIQKLKSV